MILLLLLIRTLSYLFMIRTQTRNVYILVKQNYWPQFSKGGTFQLRKDNRSLSHDEDGGSENVAESEFASFPFFHSRSFSLRQPLLAVSHLLTAATKIFMHFFSLFFVSFFFYLSLKLFLCYPRRCRNQYKVEEKTRLLQGCHSFPSAKLTLSCQWLSQDISLFLHEISLSLEISVH